MTANPNAAVSTASPMQRWVRRRLLRWPRRIKRWLPHSLFGRSLLIIVLPVLRACALAYTLLPLRLGRAPAPGAEAAFRLAAHLRPWAMAEVFLIGVVVALVKIGGMATVDLGPAFWAMAGLVVLVVYEGTALDEWSIWQILERTRAA